MSTYTSVSLQAYRKCSILHVYLLIKMFWFGLFETFKTGVFTVLEHLENQGTPNETFTGPGKFIEMNKILKGMDISIVSIILFNLNSLVQTVLCEWVFYSKVFVRILDKLWKCISQKVWEPWNKHCSVLVQQGEYGESSSSSFPSAGAPHPSLHRAPLNDKLTLFNCGWVMQLLVQRCETQSCSLLLG